MPGTAFRLLPFVLLIVTFAFPAEAQGQKRIALLIGNESYMAAVGPLKNPHNDVTLVGKALEQVGFVVTIYKDLGFKGLNAAVRRHIRETAIGRRSVSG